ncbi:TetR/AcrR family transcriptional regulator [Actinomyces howellii]|nr:TetR/AcrR family transcriptional regulator [Actinomyces howellii]
MSVPVKPLTIKTVRTTDQGAAMTRPRSTPPSGEERRLRKRENTRARLVEAAAVVVATKGLADTRIDDVVSEAGFTRGAFYSNYSSLDEVITEAIRMRAARLLARVRAAVEAMEVPTIDTLMEMLDSIGPEAHTLHLIATEQLLHRIRHPEAPVVPGTDRRDFNEQINGIVEACLHRMGRRASVPVEAITDAVCLFFLESLLDQAAGTGAGTDQAQDPRAYLRMIIESVVLGLSHPVAEPEELGPSGSRRGAQHHTEGSSH